jgi:hypothetical protein
MPSQSKSHRTLPSLPPSTTPHCLPIFPLEQSPHDAHLPNNDNLVVCWGNNWKISMAFANWIPLDDVCPSPATACPTTILKGMQHAKEILGKSFYTFEFYNVIWTTNNNMPFDHKPTMDDISTTKSHGSGYQKPTSQ